MGPRRGTMPQSVNVAILGDYTPSYVTHTATDLAIAHAATTLGLDVRAEWVPTATVEAHGAAAALDRAQGVWVSAGSPYVSMSGALEGVRFARERGKPMVAT